MAGNVRGAPEISVIVPAYNAAHYLRLSLPPLIAMRESGAIKEVLVVDDCSPDSSNVETAKSLGATVIVMDRNGGPGAARNHASKVASGDILWLIDADVVVHPGAAEILTREFFDAGVGAVFGSYDSEPPARNFASQYKNLVHRYYHQRGREESETFWSGCGAIRKSVYLDLGGFDGARFGRPSIEDIEFGFRMRGAGWRIRLAHDLLCTHLKHWSLPEVVRTDIFQRAIPWSFLILSGRGMNNDLNVSGAERVRAGIAGLWALSMLAALIPAFWPTAQASFLALTLGMIVANWNLIAFFNRERGPLFAAGATVFHQIYYIYSTCVFVLCALSYRFGGKKDHIVGRVGSKGARSEGLS